MMHGRILRESHAHTRLIRESEAAEQSLKARIRAQAVKIGVDFDEDDGVRTIFVGLLNPTECPILVIEAYIDECYPQRGDILSF